MALQFPWSEPDPVKKRRRELEEETRKIAAKTAALQDHLTRIHQPEPEKTEPPKPVWRAEEDQENPESTPEKQPLRRGKLRAHQQRDRNLFVALLVALVLILFVIARCASNH